MTEYEGVKRSKTEQLRQLLDDRGVKWKALSDRQDGDYTITATRWHDSEGGLLTMCICEPDGSTWDFFWYPTPEQAVEATLGAIPRPNPTWERWLKSLKHDEVKTICDAVEQLMYEAIEFGGDMGPNGNTYNGIDEGDVLTAGFINGWVARFEATLGRGTCKLEQHGSLADQPSMVCWSCSECGFGWHHSIYDKQFSYCPNCGRMVEA